jgi:uncharacterized membrane protein
MNKQEFLETLKQNLSRLPAGEIEEILADYREHFAAGLQAGKSESEIAAALGNPRSVAQSYQVSSLINEVQSTSSTVRSSELLIRILLRFCVLAPFNFLVLFGPFVVIVALVAAGWAVSLSVGGASIFGLLSSFGLGLDLMTATMMFFALLGLLGLAVMTSMIMLLVTRGVILLISSYVRWNINFINPSRV